MERVLRESRARLNARKLRMGAGAWVVPHQVHRGVRVVGELDRARVRIAGRRHPAVHPAVSNHGWVVIDPPAGRVCLLDADPLVGRPLRLVLPHWAATVQRVPVAAAAGVVVVPQDHRALPRGDLEPLLARGHVRVPRPGAVPRVGAAELLDLADGLAVLREDRLPALFDVVQVPKDGGEPVLMSEMTAQPDVALVRVELKLCPIHVAVVILALIVSQQLHRLVV
mmetsp:Transcript_61942/g.181038  ORF Transcript_61942/g.181038 Transcript_61942/m.181038 type:complete len:225 (+) Transcript_61942:187-861(+)